MPSLIIRLRDGVAYEVVDQNPSADNATLCLHGFTGSADSWSFLNAYMKNTRLIQVSLLGHGKTDSPANVRRYAMSQQLADLVEILNQLKLHKVNILGYSMGGRIALSFASRYPDRVNKLILESASPGLLTFPERMARIKHDHQLAQKLRHEGLVKFIDFWESIPLFASQKTLSAETQAQLREGRLKADPLGLARSLEGIGTGSQPSVWKALKHMNLPVLLICGTLDEKFCKIAKRMQQELEGSQYILAEQAGHTVHVEQPHFFGKIVSEFITQD
ncbi:2-succinyl-6-hydroxy-2,4-cyclohexadiene-1-carboxylate synthase [Bacillus pumilus]|uniref:2-succinyl-6-hydroxy-2, 4-cyclohexadiene-1-carboxylate synthase n=1 Tax=Bacillus pumilus TaxID=1408 RepID=UPI0011E97880|nr:2-succinyl-6-hydroxy-2,4-cyclohexadiene-1-carboxylate synthase [Bacillus pumilus]TYS27172.1 2-succinyl-6-hydroxy-2,4-cyclohexadiene-1-carboxylate synthase [Bacillus pumilus]TYS39981.1 2-succinyl-6-hydroxy-2,4-cyclohexadiene-1-carboxylate synthase [Bacillus pumilus]